MASFVVLVMRCESELKRRNKEDFYFLTFLVFGVRNCQEGKLAGMGFALFRC